MKIIGTLVTAVLLILASTVYIWRPYIQFSKRYNKRLLSNKLQCLGIQSTIVIALSLFFVSCGRPIETVSVDELFWSAYQNPESFDDNLDTVAKDSRTTDCFDQFQDSAFSSKNNKLLECAQMLEGSVFWNDCHDDADAFHNQGVLLDDIARTIEGLVRFDATHAYLYLYLIKTEYSNVADWNIYIDTLQDATPNFECEYKDDFKIICTGNCEYFWE